MPSLEDSRRHRDRHAISSPIIIPSPRRKLSALKARAGDAVLVTTEKDFVRLAPQDRAGIAVLASAGTLRRRGGAG